MISLILAILGVILVECGSMNPRRVGPTANVDIAAFWLGCLCVVGAFALIWTS